MNKYYRVMATIDGDKDELFGSFTREDCKYEIEAERESWTDQGYRNIKIIVSTTDDTPDPDVYADDLITKAELFKQQAPSFNFELSPDELLAEALDRGYVTKVNGVNDQYLINKDY